MCSSDLARLVKSGKNKVGVLVKLCDSGGDANDFSGCRGDFRANARFLNSSEYFNRGLGGRRFLRTRTS